MKKISLYTNLKRDYEKMKNSLIDYDLKNPLFWYSLYNVYNVFNVKYSINYDDFQEVMNSILEEHLSLNGVTPEYNDTPDSF